MYYKYSEFLVKKYGQKVYKLPINIPCTCPNRDGKISYKGCYFCSEVGTGFESQSSTLSVKEQLLKNMDYIRKKYKANKFIAYFQNYTNTYIDIKLFERYVEEAVIDDIVEIVISTRPDCVEKEHLEVLKRIKDRYGVNTSIELGLQSVNNETLKMINRGHTVEDFIEAVHLIKEYDMEVCTHFILNLPYDEKEDIINGAKLMNKLGVDGVKIHSLYIAKGTVFEKMYNDNEFLICSVDEYIENVAAFIASLNPDIYLQRLVARAPKEHTVFCNWNISWWKIHDNIIQYMECNNLKQGVNYKEG